MNLIEITKKDGNAFNVNESNLLSLYTNGGKNMVSYLDVTIGIKKQMEIEEAVADVFATTQEMVATTSGGSTIYLNINRVAFVTEKNSLAVVSYNEDKDSPTTINLDVDRATFLAAITAGEDGFTSRKVVLTKAEVLTLNSANGGYGYEILPKPGVGKYYQIRNVICLFKLDSGGNDSGSLEIYPNDSGSRYAISLGTYFNVGTPSKRLYEPVMITGFMSDFTKDEEIWIWCDTEQVNADGTLTITFDYKLIDPETL